MQLSNRHLTIIKYIAVFGYLGSRHIKALVFHDLASKTSFDRDIKKLRDGRYVDGVERRLIGGANAGSGQFVYRLGPEGRKLLPDARKAPYLSEIQHALMIVDVYVILHQLEREGRLMIVGWLTEPESALKFGRDTIEPDLLVDMARPGGGNHIRIVFEVDRASEGPKQIGGKLARWWSAFQSADDGQWLQSQVILWVVPDEKRKQELAYLISRGTVEQQKLFRVLVIDQLASALGS